MHLNRRVVVAVSRPARGEHSTLSKGARACAAGCRAVALVVVAMTIAQSPASAWERRDIRGASAFTVPAPPRDPDFPVLPGVVGPRIDAIDGTTPESGSLDEASFPPVTAGRNVHDRPVVPPAPASWDRSAEDVAVATGNLRGRDETGRHGDRLIIAVVIVAASGLALAAVLAAFRRANRSSTTQLPLSILHGRPTGTHR